MILRLTLLLFLGYCQFGASYDVSYDNRAVLIDGKRQLLLSGSIHYPRSTPGMWSNIINQTVNQLFDSFS
jgi:hypothetical protein